MPPLGSDSRAARRSSTVATAWKWLGSGVNGGAGGVGGVGSVGGGLAEHEQPSEAQLEQEESTVAQSEKYLGTMSSQL